MSADKIPSEEDDDLQESSHNISVLKRTIPFDKRYGMNRTGIDLIQTETISRKVIGAPKYEDINTFDLLVKKRLQRNPRP